MNYIYVIFNIGRCSCLTEICSCDIIKQKAAYSDPYNLLIFQIIHPKGF